jgi:hypothetical protein
MKRLIAAALALAIAPLAEAQIPRTAGGYPDLQGVWENQFMGMTACGSEFNWWRNKIISAEFFIIPLKGGDSASLSP